MGLFGPSMLSGVVNLVRLFRTLQHENLRAILASNVVTCDLFTQCRNGR